MLIAILTPQILSETFPNVVGNNIQKIDLKITQNWKNRSFYTNKTGFVSLNINNIKFQRENLEEIISKKLIIANSNTKIDRIIEKQKEFLKNYDSSQVGPGLSAIYEESGSQTKLTVSGYGAMIDWTSDINVPWNKERGWVQVLIIDSGVTKIGSYAFYWFYSLNTLSFSRYSNLESIGDMAFVYCSRMMSLEIPNQVTSIGKGAFAEWKALTSIVFPSSVTSIGDQAFNYCPTLSSVIILGNIQNIGLGAFQGCPELRLVKYCGTSNPFSGSLPFFGCPVGTVENPILVSSNYNHSYFCSVSNLLKILDPYCQVPTPSRSPSPSKSPSQSPVPTQSPSPSRSALPPTYLFTERAQSKTMIKKLTLSIFVILLYFAQFQ